MDAVVFDIHGKYGLFKKPYSPLSPVSFPLPPPTAVFGMIGAIIGLDKREYLERLQAWDDHAVQVGIRLLNPIQRYRTGLNLLITKGTKFFRPKKGNARTQIPAEFLKDPGFRIFFAHQDREILDAVQANLQAGKTVYTPVLGLAQCIAQVRWQGRFPVEQMDYNGNELNMNCVIPVSSTGASVQFRKGVRLTRLRVPARMHTDRTVTRFEDVVVNESAQGITVRDLHQYQVIGQDKVLLF